MKKPTIKTHNHFYYSPLSVINNYIKQTKNSIQQFFNQYLETQGKDKLFLFNRYMIIIMLLNIEIKLFLICSIIVFIIVKLIKIKPWEKLSRNNKLPISFINKKNRIRKKSQDMQNQLKKSLEMRKKKEEERLSKLREKKQLNKGNQKKQTEKNNNAQNFLLNFYLKENKTSPQIQNKCLLKQQNKLLDSIQPQNDEQQQLIQNFHPQNIQKSIYQTINKFTKQFTNNVWYLKWKSIGFLYILIILIYLFQPSQTFKKDTFHIIATHDDQDGQIQIQSIKRTSQLINQFYLVLIWLFSNISIFYYYGKARLRQQLFQQIYNREYKDQNLKKSRSKFKGRRIFTDNDGEDEGKNSSTTSKSDLSVQQEIKFHSFRKQKKSKNKSTENLPIQVQISKLKEFSLQDKLEIFSHAATSISPMKKGQQIQKIQKTVLTMPSLFKKEEQEQSLKIELVDSQDAQSQAQQAFEQFNNRKIQNPSPKNMSKPPNLIINSHQYSTQKIPSFDLSYSPAESVKSPNLRSKPPQQNRQKILKNTSIDIKNQFDDSQPQSKLIKRSLFTNKFFNKNEQNILQNGRSRKRKGSQEVKRRSRVDLSNLLNKDQVQSRKNQDKNQEQENKLSTIGFKIKLIDVELTNSFRQQMKTKQQSQTK